MPQSKPGMFPTIRKERRHAFDKFVYNSAVFCFFLPLPSGVAGGGGALFTLFSTFAFLDGGLPCNGRKRKGAFTFEVFLDIFSSCKYSFFDDIEENVFIYVQSQGNLFQALSRTKSLPFGVKTAVHAGLIAILKRQAYNSTTL